MFQYKRVTDEVRRYKEKVSRNRLSAYLEPLIQEYLGEITDLGSFDKLKYCFVKNPSQLDVLTGVIRQISLHLSNTVRMSGRVVEPASHDDLRSALGEKLTTGLRFLPKGQLVLLLGRVGAGKTTFLTNFLRVEQQELFKKHILVPIDFRLLEKGGSVHHFFYQSLVESLGQNPVFLSLTSDQVRDVYKSEIKELRKGPLAKLEQVNKKLFEEKVAEFLLEKYRDAENHHVRVLRYLANMHEIRCVFIFDNADQHDFDLQQEIFRFAHSVTEKCYAFSIVSLREETYLRSKQSGALSAYPTFAYALPSTSVVEIIDRRLDYIVKELQEGRLARQLLGEKPPIEDVVDFLMLVKNSIFRNAKRVRFFLESVAMGNLRRAMEVFSSFLTSGHTDADKILWICRNHSDYLVPLHEFIKSIGLGDSRYYHGESSPVLNLYAISDESRPSHFTKLRLLAYLYHHRNHTSALGVGFVRTETIETEFLRIGTSKPDISESLRIMARYSLIQNDIYDPSKIGEGYHITLAGRYYLRYLAVRFAYLDQMLQDTPISDNQAFCAILDRIDSREMDERFARVQAFWDYLVLEEDREHAVVIQTSDAIPLRRKVLFSMYEEYQTEVLWIKGKIAKYGKDAAQVATPYTPQE